MLDSNSFNTLVLDEAARNPSQESSMYPDFHRLIQPHIQSFDAIFGGPPREESHLYNPSNNKAKVTSDHFKSPDECQDSLGLLDLSLQNIDERVVQDGHGNTIRFWIEQVQCSRSVLPESNRYATRRAVLPRECRGPAPYKGRLQAKLLWSINGAAACGEWVPLGYLPLMVRSRSKCHLGSASPADLVRAGEDAEECGGYFIVHGIERIIRLLLFPSQPPHGSGQEQFQETWAHVHPVRCADEVCERGRLRPNHLSAVLQRWPMRGQVFLQKVRIPDPTAAHPESLGQR